MLDYHYVPLADRLAGELNFCILLITALPNACLNVILLSIYTRLSSFVDIHICFSIDEVTISKLIIIASMC